MPAPEPGWNLVPRWRTMIEPACTPWPAKTFTPSRLAWESRPFLEEPRPFLCAISVPPSDRDVGDLDHRLVRAVAPALAVGRLRLVLEAADLLAERVLDDRRLD